MSAFDLLDTKDYKTLIENFNPVRSSKIQEELIQTYTTPRSSYIKESARGKSFAEVQPHVLKYIIETCHQCSYEEKYRAILVVLYLLHEQYKAKKNIDDIISDAKEKLIPYVLVQTKKKVIDLSFLDTVTKKYTDNFFYALKITIGANTIYKYGFTNSNPRHRIAQIKNDILSNYSKQTIVIEPQLLIHCDDARKFENEVKASLSEHHINSTNYNFKGSSETYSSSKKNEVLNIIKSLQGKYRHELLYNIEAVAEIQHNPKEKNEPSHSAQHAFD